MSVRTARTYERRGAAAQPAQAAAHLPHAARTRSPTDWPWIVEPARARSGPAGHDAVRACCASAHPGRYQAAQLRTLQRQIATWRAQHGPEREVIFPQVHRAGRGRPVRLHAHDRPGRHAGRRAVPAPALPPGAQSTRTSRRSRSASRRASRRWPKGWSAACGSSAACRASTAPITSSAAIRPLDADGRAQAQRALQRAAWRTTGWSRPPTTLGVAHENGDVEQAHHRFKQAVDQALRVRGSRDFPDRAAYDRFLQRPGHAAQPHPPGALGRGAGGAAPAAGDAAGAVPRGAGAGQPLQHHPGAAQHLLGAVAADRHDACWCGCAPRRWRSTAARRSC